jgi:hypothetical protein
MGKYIDAHDDEAYADFIKPLAKYKDEWLTMSLQSR